MTDPFDYPVMSPHDCIRRAQTSEARLAEARLALALIAKAADDVDVRKLASAAIAALDGQDKP